MLSTHDFCLHTRTLARSVRIQCTHAHKFLLVPGLLLGIQLSKPLFFVCLSLPYHRLSFFDVFKTLHVPKDILGQKPLFSMACGELERFGELAIPSYVSIEETKVTLLFFHLHCGDLPLQFATHFLVFLFHRTDTHFEKGPVKFQLLLEKTALCVRQICINLLELVQLILNDIKAGEGVHKEKRFLLLSLIFVPYGLLNFLIKVHRLFCFLIKIDRIL